MPYKNKSDQKSYDKKRDATPARRKARSLNVTARRKMAKKYGWKALKGKDVDHIKPITRGGRNGTGNLRVISRKKNRSRRSR